MFGGQR